MADLSPVAANVAVVSGSPQTGIAGATLTRGMAVYLDAATSTLKQAHCETSAATAACVGIALADVASGQYVPYLPNGGTINLGATLTVGTPYVLSTAGLIAPVADLASNDYVTLLGVATTAANLPLNIIASGVQKP